ncbi:hypothetical protein DJ55_4203 [Yersinia pseudotuberculosis]|nr:hypothetical protein DJ55_4203 [Yersinia pseudotuberculosis]
MMRNLPPKWTAGLARVAVKSFNREPRPPARMSATVLLGNCLANINESVLSNLTIKAP